MYEKFAIKLVLNHIVKAIKCNPCYMFYVH